MSSIPKEAKILSLFARLRSWLNISENELSSMTRQCVTNRRFEDIETLLRETSAWSVSSNDKQRGVNWQFTIDKARVKLKSLYPNF